MSYIYPSHWKLWIAYLIVSSFFEDVGLCLLVLYMDFDCNIFFIFVIKGLYKDTKKNEMSLGICSRTNDVVEPMIKPQWFVNCSTMAKAGLDAVRSKKIEIIPQQYEQDWYRYYIQCVVTCNYHVK
jgi:hypothetical protein